MHADDEYVGIDDYLTSIKVMALAIYEWCNAAPIIEARKAIAMAWAPPAQ
jgi:acetylornithine deacetylase